MSTYAVVNPATGEKVKEYEEISDADLDAAIAGADAAYRGWTTSTTVAERAGLIRRVGELHGERREKLAGTESTAGYSTCATITAGRPLSIRRR